VPKTCATLSSEVAALSSCKSLQPLAESKRKVNESPAVGGVSKGLLAKNRDYAQNQMTGEQSAQACAMACFCPLTRVLQDFNYVHPVRNG
jgi:hypothetical protein